MHLLWWQCSHFKNTQKLSSSGSAINLGVTGHAGYRPVGWWHLYHPAAFTGPSDSVTSGAVILGASTHCLQVPGAPNSPQCLEVPSGKKGRVYSPRSKVVQHPLDLSCPRACVAIESLKYGSSELSCAVRIKCTMDFADKIKKNAKYLTKIWILMTWWNIIFGHIGLNNTLKLTSSVSFYFFCTMGPVFCFLQ